MPVITLPTGQLMVIPDGLAGALQMPGQVAQAGQQIERGIEASPAITPAEKMAKVAQWVAYKDQVMRAANPDMSPQELDRHAMMNHNRYASFLGLPVTPMGGGKSVDEQIAADEKQRAADEKFRQEQIQHPGRRNY